MKIVGKPEAVQQAKEKILEILDTKASALVFKELNIFICLLGFYAY